MNIGIDARMYGPSVGGGGLGRYVEQLVTELQLIDTRNRYVLFLKKENFNACVITNTNFEKRLADVHWYTLEEQHKMGRLIDHEHLDLVHFPHWNVPLFVRTPFVVTIHDLILLAEPYSAKISTRHPLFFAVKYQGYRVILNHAIHASKKIISVSNATAGVIKKFFPSVSKNKIEVVYEGVSELNSNIPARPTGVPQQALDDAKNQDHSTTSASLLYIGNAYPHKNLERLLEAFAILRETHPNAKLILAGTDSIFYKRLLANIPYRVTFVPNPTDDKLAELYRHATLFVFPSRVEGFGLPPLEAMSMGVPVVASDIPSLREILGDNADYFPPNDTIEMARVFTRLLDDPTRREQLITRGTKHIKQFSWKTMTTKIKALYETCGTRTA